jgi:hypothetical protein
VHRSLAEAPAALVGPVLIITSDPGIEIGLEFADGAGDLLAEHDPVELVQHRLVEALNDAVIRYEICGTLLSDRALRRAVLW